MFCPACGARNSDDAKFCNQCGVRIASMAPLSDPVATTLGPSSAAAEAPAGPAVVPSPGGSTIVGVAPPVSSSASTLPDGAASPPSLAPQWPTQMTSGTSIVLPMSGPSKRTMVIAGACIALAGIGLGAGIAWKAFRRSTSATQEHAEIPETNVALVEVPTLLATHDAGANNGAEEPMGGARGRVRGGTANGSNRGDPAPATGGARTSASAGGMMRPSGASNSGVAPVGGTRNASADRESARGARTPGGGDVPSSAGEPSGAERAQSNSGNASAGGGSSASASASASESSGSPPPELGSADPGLQPRGPRRSGYTLGEETDATGTMDPAVFSYVYRHYRSQIAACHSTVARGREVVGTMRVRVRLGEDGRVRRTRVVSDTTNEPALETCVQNAIQTWRYPRPEGGEVEFEYSFGFGH